MTSNRHSRRYLCWNGVGFVTSFRESAVSTFVEVRFTDASAGSFVRMEDKFGFTMAALAKDGAFFASPYVPPSAGKDGAAAEAGQVGALAVLRDAGANLESPNLKGQTPAWAAAQRGHVQVLALLRDAHADLAAPDHLGQTPAFAAAASGIVSRPVAASFSRWRSRNAQ